MRIQQLHNRHHGKAIYIVGTGPSLRLFPSKILEGQVVLGLNQAWKHVPLTYVITVHPELYTEYENCPNKPEVRPHWIIKRKPPLDLPLNHSKHFVFNTSPDEKVMDTLTCTDELYIGRGVQQTAMHMAALMGAKIIYLVGVDMTDLGGDHHGHEQHVRFHGVDPDLVYKEYRHYTANARKILSHRFHLHVLKLSPLIGECDGDEDYLRQCQERDLPKFPPPVDTSAYKREPPTL